MAEPATELVTDAAEAVVSGGVPLTTGEGVIYGLIQGLTEFLPVSSSGHLALAHQWGLGSLPERVEMPFDVLLHAATLIAIMVAFRKEIMAACQFKNGLAYRIVLASIPAGIVGLLCGDYIEQAGDSWWLMAVCYLFTCILLTVSEALSLRRQAQSGGESAESATEVAAPLQVSWLQAVVVGILQVPALLPGVSRSGSTVAAGLLAGLKPQAAIGFSFLVGLPLIAGATAKKGLEGGFTELIDVVGIVPIAAAFVASLISGFLAIGMLKIVAGSGKLRWFAGYCFLVALVCLWNAVQ